MICVACCIIVSICLGAAAITAMHWFKNCRSSIACYVEGSMLSVGCLEAAPHMAACILHSISAAGGHAIL